jgi:hypothetical protein
MLIFQLIQKYTAKKKLIYSETIRKTLKQFRNSETISFFFSIVHAIKSKARNRLTIATLDALTRLKLNTIDWSIYDCTGAFQLWLDAAKGVRYFMGGHSGTNDVPDGLVSAEQLQLDLSDSLS